MGTFSRSRYGKMIARAVGRTPKPRRLRTRIALENLEDRSVPAVFTVTTNADSGAGSLREAVTSANGAGGADTIDFDTTFFNQARTISLASGLTIGDAVTIDASAVVGPVTLDGGGFATFAINADLTIDSLTITGGSGGQGPLDVDNGSANVTVLNSTITGNLGLQAGAINIPFGASGLVTVESSTISGNTGGTGGIYFYSGGSLRVSNSTISGNTGTANNPFNAGGIIMYGTIGAGGFTIENSTIADNTSASSSVGGGGIGFGFANGVATIRNSTITGNTAPANAPSGAGIGGYGAYITMALESTIVAQNTGPASPDIGVYYFSGTAINATTSIIGVQPVMSGGATFNDNGGNQIGSAATPLDPLLAPLGDYGGPTQTRLPYGTSPALAAGSGGPATDQRGLPRPVGLADVGAVERQAGEEAPPSASGTGTDVTAPTSTVTITVVYTDIDGPNPGIDDGTFDDDDILVTGPNGFSEFATFDSFTVDGDNWTVTYTLTYPGAGSFSNLDNGFYDVNLVAGEVEDLDGNAVGARVLDTFLVVIQPILVTNADDDGAGSLREAILLANSTPGDDTISFDPTFFSTPQTITLTSPLPDFTAAGGGLEIAGPGIDLLTLDANGTGRAMTSFAPTLTLSGFVVTGGVAAVNTNGGGLLAASDVFIDNMVFTDNSTTFSAGSFFDGGSGGGIALAGGDFDMTITDSTISGNSAGTNGGGVFLRYSFGDLLVQNSTISGNQTTYTSNYFEYFGGGGLFIAGTGDVQVLNSTVANNTAAGSGGGIFGNGASGLLTVRSSTITGNDAGADDVANPYYTTGGGGLGFVFGNPVTLVVNSIVSGNTNIFANDINAADFVVFTTFSAIGDTNGFTDLSGFANIAPGTDLLLGPLADNGGPTMTILPGEGSPLIDAGDSTSTTAPTDQRGEIRIVGDAVDIGAVESQIVPFDVSVEQGAGQLDPTPGPIVTFDVQFSEDTADFDIADVTFGGTFLANGGTFDSTVFSFGGGTYQIVVSNLSAGDQGTITASIAAGAATNVNGDPNTPSTSVDNSVTVDVAPTVVVTGDNSPTNGDLVFTATFNEAVTGFDETDVTLDIGTGVTGTPTIVVTGGPTTYTITVSGLSGDGTVGATLAAGVALDSVNNPNEPSNLDATVDVDTVVPTATIAPVDATDPTYGSSVSFTVTFSEDVTGFDSADVVVGGTAVGGTAVVTPVSGSVYTVTVSGFTAGGTVIVTVPNGAGLDGAGNASTAATGDGTTTLVLTGTLQFSSPTYTVTEEGLIATVTVTRTGGTEGVLTVAYATTAGTAGATDFTAATGTLTFAAGSAVSQDISVTILNDSIDEADETFTITLSSATADGIPTASVLGTPAVATVTIIGLEPDGLFFSSPTATVTEGGAANALSVVRTGDNTLAASADYTITFAGAASAADFATGTVFTGTVNFAAGSSVAQPILLPIFDDSLNEGNETFTVTLSNFVGSPGGSPTAATVTIAPSDGAASKVAVTDADGDLVTVSVGKGATVLTYISDPDGNGQGPIELIQVSGAATTVAIKVKKGASGDGLVEVGGITAGALKGVAGAKAILTGDFLAIGAVKSLVFAEVQAGSTIEAGSVAKIVTKGNKNAAVAGNFSSDVTLNGPGVGSKGLTLGALTVKGVVSDSTFDITGNVNKVKAAGFVDSTMDITGSLTSFTITGLTNAFATSNVTASSIKTVVLNSANTANGGTAFGFTVDLALTSLKLGKPVTFTYKASVDGLVNGGDKATGDFTVDVI